MMADAVLLPLLSCRLSLTLSQGRISPARNRSGMRDGVAITIMMGGGSRRCNEFVNLFCIMLIVPQGNVCWERERGFRCVTPYRAHVVLPSLFQVCGSSDISIYRTVFVCHHVPTDFRYLWVDDALYQAISVYAVLSPIMHAAVNLCDLFC